MSSTLKATSLPSTIEKRIPDFLVRRSENNTHNRAREYFIALPTKITSLPARLLLHQWQYTLDILERAGMTDCKPCSTPVDTQGKVSEEEGTPVTDPTAYQSLAGALQYLTFTRPDITYAVQQICLHMHDPREPHLTALKRILRYLRGTVDFGLLHQRSSSTELVVYTDAD